MYPSRPFLLHPVLGLNPTWDNTSLKYDNIFQMELGFKNTILSVSSIHPVGVVIADKSEKWQTTHKHTWPVLYSRPKYPSPRLTYCE